MHQERVRRPVKTAVQGGLHMTKDETGMSVTCVSRNNLHRKLRCCATLDQLEGLRKRADTMDTFE